MHDDDAEASHARAVRRRARALAGTALIAALGLAIRLPGAAATGLWRDEGLFLFVVRLPGLGQMLSFLRWHEGHPPLFYLLMRGWLRLLGESTAAVLSLPLVLGTALIALSVAVGRRMFSARAGALAGALVALSPLDARYAAQVRPYSLLPVLAIAAMYALWQGLSGEPGRASPARRPLWWVAYTLCAAALLFTHNWGWLIFAAQGVIVATWLVLSAPGRGAVLRHPRLPQALRAMAAAGLLYLPWLPAFVHQLRHAWAGPALVLPAGPWRAASGPCGVALVGMGLAGVLVIALSGPRERRRGPGWAALAGDPGAPARSGLALLLALGIPLVALAAALLASFWSNMLHAGCLDSIEPHFLVGLAGAVAAPRPCRLRSGARLALLGVLALFAVGWTHPLMWRKSNAREVAAAVAARALPQDLVVIVPEIYASSWNYYFTADNEQLDYPSPGRTGVVAFTSLRERLLDPAAFARAAERLGRAREQGRRVWLITECRGLTDGVPEGGAVPRGVRLSGDEAEALRTNQVRRLLGDLYGPPERVAVPGDIQGTWEQLCAFLFQAGPAGGRR